VKNWKDIGCKNGQAKDGRTIFFFLKISQKKKKKNLKNENQPTKDYFKKLSDNLKKFSKKM
jgi:hypothetical protein